MSPISFFCLLAESDDTTQKPWLIIIAAIMFIILLLNLNYRRRAMGGSPKQYRREIDTANMKTTAIHRDMERLLVELNELSRQINAQIDTKFAKLEQSIADADKRIQFLRILLDAAKKAELTDLPDPIASLDHDTAPGTRATSRNLDVTVGDGGISETRTPAPNEATKVNEQAVSDASDDLHDKIYRLADEGQSTVDIARALQHNVGEVELILNLRRRTNNVDD
ncbi:MAG: hypothetical protein MI923_19405 [Phycisphaerales bacterium]|nr:hypothetical protein [Phycisphaerales bacterium]